MGASSSFTMNNGLDCPMIGLATSKIKKKHLEEIVYESIVAKIYLIDTEPENEESVGKAIKKALENRIVKREDLFIATKLEIEEKENPESALLNSLSRLQLSYVDLYLDHWPSCRNYNAPEPNNQKIISIKDTWEKMEKLVTDNLTKSIGVCNYNVENLLNIISICKIKPAVNEVEFHPYLYQKDLKEFCQLEKIRIFAYNPLSIGEYDNKNIILEKKSDLYLEAPLNYIADKYKKNRTEVVLNWHRILGNIPILGINIKGPGPEIKEENIKEEITKEIKEKINYYFEDEQTRKINIDEKYIELLCSFTENQYRFNDSFDIFGVNIFA